MIYSHAAVRKTEGLRTVLFGASSFIWESPFGDDKIYLAKHVASMGFDVLEICIENPTRVSAPAIRSAAEEAGIGLSVCGAFGSERDVSHEDSERRLSGIDYLKFCVDLAAEVGSPNVVGPMYSATGKTRLLSEDKREQQRNWAARSLLGGVAAEVFGSVEEASSHVELRNKATEPEQENVSFYEECYEVHRSLYPATKDAMKRLSDLAEKANKLERKGGKNG